MAAITFNIPDEHLPRLVEALSEHYGYKEILVTGEPNPETRAQFIKRKTALQWIQITRNYERQIIEPAPVDVS